MSSVRAMTLIVLLGTASVQAQEPRWTSDVTLASYVEAWDLNETREVLNGLQAGIDGVVWRGLAVRTEAVALHVQQLDRNAWITGVTLGMRARRDVGLMRWHIDLAGGRARATTRVPPRGTRGNYILLLGAGAEILTPVASITFGGRWFHLSNNGSEGRARNPDIQALGGFFGAGWRF